MKLVFLSHVSDCAGGAQRCLLDLLRGLKRIHPDWQLYMVLPGPGDLLDACSPYLDGYRFLQMEWWLVGKDMDIGTREKLSYIRKLLKYSIKLTRYLRRIKPDYGQIPVISCKRKRNWKAAALHYIKRCCRKLLVSQSSSVRI